VSLRFAPLALGGIEFHDEGQWRLVACECAFTASKAACRRQKAFRSRPIATASSLCSSTAAKSCRSKPIEGEPETLVPPLCQILPMSRDPECVTLKVSSLRIQQPQTILFDK
jgi:hypothetical protein